MLGLLLSQRVKSRRGEISVEKAEVFSLPCVGVTISLGRSEQRRLPEALSYASDRLREIGVTNVVFRRDFEYGSFFPDFSRPNKNEILKAKALEIAETASPGARCAALLSRLADTDSVRLCMRLARRYPDVLADLGAFTLRVAEDIKYRTGASILVSAQKKLYRRAQTAIVLGDGDFNAEFSDECSVLHIGGRKELALGGRLITGASVCAKGIVPEGFDAFELMAAAFSAGKLAAEEITLKSLCFLDNES